MQRKYSTKFKNHAVQQVLERSEHQTITDVAMSLGVNIFTLKQWLKAYRRKNNPTVNISQDEIQLLKNELARKNKLIIEMSALLVSARAVT
jgi:transposase-like protein